jgi:quercetin dioxygenase-like cupin family protein
MPEIIAMGGLTLRFLQTGAETDGGPDLFELTLEPAARMPVPHYHESWDETVYGLSGTSLWRLDGVEHALSPGGSLFIRRGVVHGFANGSDAAASCLCILTPGRLGTAYFKEIAALLAGGAPDPVAMGAVMRRYGLVPAPGGKPPG